METLAVNGVRIFAGVPESVRAARAWIADCLPDSPAAADAALMVSELFTNAILYSMSGHPGGVVTVSIAIGRGKARIHVIDQGGHPRAQPGGSFRRSLLSRRRPTSAPG